MLDSRGYTLEMRDGEKWFCRREQALGSRIGQAKHCGTASMLYQNRMDQQDETRKTSKSMMTPNKSLYTAAGAGPKREG